LWREEIRRAWCELRGPEVSAGRVAKAVALGLFVGALPLFGAGTPVIVVASLWFGLDGLLAWVLSCADSPLFFHRIRDIEAAVPAPWWVSAPAVGALLGTMGAVLALAFTAAVVARRPKPPYRLPEGAPDWVKAVERVATRYALPQSPRPHDRVLFHHIRGKLLADPAARLVAELGGDEHEQAKGPLGSVLDIGSGRGQVALLLLELGRATSVRGLDWDRRKIESAVRAAGAHQGAPKLDAAFAVADARTAPLEPADTVLLVDLLHYFLPEEQDTILDRAAGAVLPGGHILVREADAGRGLRSLVTWLEERLFTFLRVNRGERVRFRDAADLVRRLEGRGLVCETRRAWGRMPFSNVLIVGHRPEAPRRPD
jgi:SAM-dependent methyltransferase